MDILSRWSVVGASLMAIGVGAAGCSGPELEGPPPPPAPYVAPPPSAAPSGRVTTELLGGPAPRGAPAEGYITMAPIPNPDELTPAERRQAYGVGQARPLPPEPARPLSGPVVAMAPIPNPEDLSPTERRRLYGRAPAEGAPAYRAPPRQSRPAGAAPRTASPRPASPRPSPPPRAVAAAPGPVTARPVAPAPKVATPAPAPKVAAPAPKAATPAPAPKVAEPAPKTTAPEPKLATPAKPAKPLTKLESLGAALSADISQGAVLNIPPNMAPDKDSFVSLTLPQSLLGRVQAEAAKLGLASPARTVDARATLKGDGYAIIPGGSQASRLKADEATTFTWQVKPQPGADGPLTAEIGGELKGQARPQAFIIGSVTKEAFPKPVQPVEPTRRFSLPDKLAIPGKPTLDLPVVGETHSGNFVLGVLAVIVALIAMAIANARANARRAAERRRKFRNFSDTLSEPTPTHTVRTETIRETEPA